MTFRESTAAYESWLATQLDVVQPDLVEKHRAMKEEIFSFLRATFYRWAQLWPTLCGDLTNGPTVLGVGDLHVENFGTWRDVEGRLVWGINDFDEAENIPYTADLTRLSASVHLAIETNHLEIGHREACSAILAGYREGLETGGRPWVLGEKHVWLSELVALKDPPAFWEKLQLLTDHDGKLPKAARRGIEKMLPAENLPYRVARRQAGLGSLGRQRFVAIAEYGGAHICREAKALAPSVWFWAQGGTGEDRLCGERALRRTVRVPDPFVRIKDGWIVRRLAPDCIKIELASVPRDKDKSKLLQAMGWETANVHVGSKNARAILADLGKRDVHWLHDAAERMIQATKSDWKEWGGKVRRR